MIICAFAKKVSLWVVGIFLLLGLSSSGYGQAEPGEIFRHELRIGSTNDSYTPGEQDYYFTNGLDITYNRLTERRLLLKDILPDEQQKTILRFRLGQEIYTPFEITENDLADLDRPYAGYLFLKTSLDNFWDSKNRLKLSVNLGVIGPKSGGKWLHTNWHKWFNFSDPEGWQYQIGHVPVINIGIEYQRSRKIARWADFIVTSGIQTGTAFNNLSLGGRIRTGDLNPMDYSSINNSRLGTGSVTGSMAPDERKEWFFFFGFNNTAVLHNALIEGGFLFSTDNIHTERAKPYLATLDAGFSYSLPAVTWTLQMNQLSTEVAGARTHNYISVDFSYRF